MLRGAREGVHREVEWLERHNLAVWILKDGRIPDARKNGIQDRAAGGSLAVRR